MPPTCTICRHPDRAAIEKALVAGGTLRNIAQRFETGYTALFRHKPHMGQALAKAQERREVSHGTSVADRLEFLWGKALSYLKQSEDAKDLRLALASTREARGVLETGAALMAAVKQGAMGTIGVEFTNDWRSEDTDLPETSAKRMPSRRHQSPASDPRGDTPAPDATRAPTRAPARKGWASADDLDARAEKARGRAGTMGPRDFGPPE